MVMMVKKLDEVGQSWQLSRTVKTSSILIRIPSLLLRSQRCVLSCFLLGSFKWNQTLEVCSDTFEDLEILWIKLTAAYIWDTVSHFSSIPRYFCFFLWWPVLKWNEKRQLKPSLLAVVGSRQYEARFKSRSRSKTGSPRRKKVSHSRSRPAGWQWSWKVKLLQVVFCLCIV